MKILIAYASKHGTAKICVERLVSNWRGLDVTAVDLEQQSVDPAEYDAVVFGSSVYFGKLRPAARRFLDTYETVLLQKTTVLFLCCGLTAEAEYYKKKLFPAALRESAFDVLFFGGSLSTRGLSFFEKIAVRSMRSALYEESIDNGDYSAPSLPGILPENIDKLATEFRRHLAQTQRGSEEG
ncbi:MAG: flavodoxin domain-containing protein [Clostridia bacterium]|nr:flavodoxin domain-containing protein [Clostridia bacterium]